MLESVSYFLLETVRFDVIRGFKLILTKEIGSTFRPNLMAALMPSIFIFFIRIDVLFSLCNLEILHFGMWPHNCQ